MRIRRSTERDIIMKITKIIAAVTAALMLCISMASCGTKTDGGKDTTEQKAPTDAEYVIGKGKLVVGITSFEPMDYQDKDGNWIGFDADMATAFADSLGVDVEFVVIDWDEKIMELDGKTIDCVWNGMTIDDGVTSAMSCSNAYCNNQQVVVVPKDKAEQYATVEACKDLQFAVENGSAGQGQLDGLGYSYTGVVDQATALMEVAGGTAEAAVIDKLMAGAMIGEGTSWANLTYTVGLNDEQYGVGFRKGSDLTEKLNKFFKDSYADGSMTNIAEKYGVQEAIIAQ